MAHEMQANLVISSEEAHHGTVRSVTLANGRPVTVSVPAGTYDGQQISFSLPGLTVNEPAGILLLTLVVLGGGGSPATVLAPAQAGTPGRTPPIVDKQSLPASAPIEATQAAGSFSASPASSSTPDWPRQNGQPQATLPGSGTAWQPQQPQPLYAPVPGPAQAPNNRTPVIVLAIMLAVILLVGGIGGIALLVHTSQVTAQQNATVTAIAADSTGTAAIQNQLNADASTATAIAQATASVDAANPDPYGAGGKLVLFNPLTSKESSNNPDIFMDESDKCAYKDAAYHVIDVSQQSISKCSIYLNGNNLASYVLEVRFTLLAGDIGGLFFNGSGGSDYLLSFDKSGNYQLTPYTLFGPGNSLAQGQATAFHRGYKQANTLAVVVQDNTFTWYINHQRVGQVGNHNYAVSSFDLVSSDYQGNTATSEAAYTNLRIWQL